MQIQSKSNRLATLAVAVVMLLSNSQSSSSLQAQENNPAAAELLEQLDSTSFQQREAATEKLAQLGPQVLKPLVAHFFDASSEAGWRIHQILEDIGRNGSEQDFLKSIALIQVLYGDQDARTPLRLAKLQYQWKEARRAEASEQLGKLGFKFDAVENPYGGRDAALQLAVREMAERPIMFQGVGQIGAVDPNDLNQLSEQPSGDTAKRKWQDPRINKQASMRTVEEIIAGSADANREIAEKLLPISQSVTLPKGTLEIPADWKSDKASLKLISDLGPLSSLKLRNQKIGSDLQEFIAKQTELKNLHLIDCKFDEQTQLVLPKLIYRYELEGSLPPIKALESIGSISSLAIRRTSLSQEEAKVLAKSGIKIIELEEVEFTRQSIQTLLDIRGLLRVRISLCDFELEWFEESRLKNPNLIAAVPKAFLGVQGGLDVSGMFAGCQVSEVVAGTAAAQAGMESLDVILETEGQKVLRFEDLRLLISQKRPGDMLNVKVLRGDKQLDLNIKLGSMDGVVP